MYFCWSDVHSDIFSQKSEPALKKARREDTSHDGLVNGTTREGQGEGGEGEEEKDNTTADNEKIPSEVITCRLTTAYSLSPPVPPTNSHQRDA